MRSWLGFPGLNWVLSNLTEFFWRTWSWLEFSGFTRFYWVLPSLFFGWSGFTELYRVFIGRTETFWVWNWIQLGFTEFFFGRSVLFWIYWTFTEFYRVLPSLYLKFTLFSLVFIDFWSWLLYRVGTGSQLGFTGFFSYVSYVRWKWMKSTLIGSTGTRVRVEPEVQGGQIHHRTGAHDQGQRLGRVSLLARDRSQSKASHWRRRWLPQSRPWWQLAVPVATVANIAVAFYCFFYPIEMQPNPIAT